MNKMLSNKKIIFMFTAPTILFFSLIVIYPVIQTLIKSFYRWDGLTQPVFHGMSNYKRLIEDPLFWKSMTNGFIFAGVLLVFELGMGAILAMIVADKRFVFKRYVKTSLFIPVVLSVTVVCQLWASIYNPEFGLINHLFETFGMDYRQDWLSGKRTAIFAVAFVNAWQYLGYQFVIFYSNIKSIPEEYYEAARIDGAAQWQVNLKILVPMLKDTFGMCLIFAITGGLNAYAHMQILTSGGPGTATYTLTYMTFRNAFMMNEYGYGCAVAIALVLQCLLFTVIINKLFSKDITQ